MRSLVLLTLGIFIGFILLSNEGYISSSNSSNQIEDNLTNKVDYQNYDPAEDELFSQSERDYFNEIAKSSEFNGGCEISRWTSDMRIFVQGDKREYLINELERIVSELNEIIDPIEIRIVDDETESNFKILFGSAEEYNELVPGSIEHTSHNWGLFVINSGTEITNGSMYVDIYRCGHNISGQKHLLREELTQALGLTNDSHEYPESIFYQNWTETTEFAPIDRKLIEMLYNYW